MVPNHVRYQTALHLVEYIILLSWQGRQDLNPRHSVLETDVLPLNYTPKNLVGLAGLEPATSRLSGVRSNHLSYKP